MKEETYIASVGEYGTSSPTGRLRFRGVPETTAQPRILQQEVQVVCERANYYELIWRDVPLVIE